MHKSDYWFLWSFREEEPDEAVHGHITSLVRVLLLTGCIYLVISFMPKWSESVLDKNDASQKKKVVDNFDRLANGFFLREINMY